MGKLSVYLWMAAGIALLYLFPAKTVMASELLPENLPQIVKWENGNGMDDTGNLIKDGWAYDTVNPAGRYVLFGTDGEVIRKQEIWGDTEETDYTSTEMNPGKIGIRCETFETFTGTVTVTMQEKNGETVECMLSSENYYEANLPVASGSYTLDTATAEWEGLYYQVQIYKNTFEVEEEKLVLVRMTVTDNVTGQAAETEPSSEDSTLIDADAEIESENGEDGEVRQDLQKKDRKSWVFFGIVCAAGLLGSMIYKKKHDKYA